MRDYTYDPNTPKEFVEVWMEEVGNLHRGQKYNGWAFFDDDRRLIDVYVTDIDGEWADIGFDLNQAEHGGFDAVIKRAKELGSTNIIQVHTHKKEEPSGPCPSMGEFVGNCIALLDEEGITLRASVILHDDELDGIMFCTEVSEEPVSGRLMPDIDQDQLLNDLREAVAKGDPVARSLLPVMEQVVASLQRGESPDPALLNKGIELALRGLAATTDTPINPLALPVYDAKRDLLN